VGQQFGGVVTIEFIILASMMLSLVGSATLTFGLLSGCRLLAAAGGVVLIASVVMIATLLTTQLFGVAVVLDAVIAASTAMLVCVLMDLLGWG